MGADMVGGAHRADLDARDGADGGEGFAAEAHGGEIEEIVGAADLRGGVALECHAGIGGRHAAAVVNDLYEGAARILDEDADLRGAGVDGVFHEFLDHGSRALYDLAGGDLVGHRVGQQTYYIVHNPSSK